MTNSKLRKVQLTELKILEKIDEICKKNNINYFLGMKYGIKITKKIYV